MREGNSSQRGKWELAPRVLAVLLAGLMAAPGMPGATGAISFPPPHSSMLISRDQELQLGRDAAQQAMHEYPVLPDSDPLTVYVRHLGERLVPTVPEPRYPYEFHVINESDINAFALPGGPLFVNLGAIQAADNEAQLAGVMAHEMAHVYMRHGAAQASKQMMAQLPLGILGAILGNGTGASLARVAGAMFANGLLLRYSRDAESEADLVGARIMYLAGYNPQAMADFFTKLEKEGGAGGPQWFSDHPNPGNRAGAIDRLISGFPRKQFTQGGAEFRQAKQMASGRKGLSAQEIANRQKQGGFAGPSAPVAATPGSDVDAGNQFQTLQHSAFTVQYPSNWQSYGDQNSMVTIAPKGGVSENAVAYGAILYGFKPEARDLESAFHELVASIRQSNPDLRQVGQDEVIRVNGVQGKSLDLLGPSPIQSNGRPLQERDWLVAVPNSQGALVYAVFIAPDKDFSSLRPTFEKMLKSLHVK